jgi:hypothetical protein
LVASVAVRLTARVPVVSAVMRAVEVNDFFRRIRRIALFYHDLTEVRNG